jgi:hypothetical protein
LARVSSDPVSGGDWLTNRDQTIHSIAGSAEIWPAFFAEGLGYPQGHMAPAEVCRAWDFRWSALDQSVVFVVPASPTLIGWEPQAFEKALARWQREIQKYRPGITLTSSTNVPSAGAVVSVSLDSNLNRAGLADRDPGQPWIIQLNPAKYTINHTEPTQSRYIDYITWLYLHEIGHIVGFRDIDALRNEVLMGQQDYGAVYRGVVTDLTCAERTGVRVTYR